MEQKPELELVLAAPRGFCAGVDRAVQIVALALAKYGAPVYVRHEIVHNRHVVAGLEARGAVFVDEIDQVPQGGHVIFSAHGVPKSVPLEAEKRGLNWLDATCPLVSKVHIEAERHHAEGCDILLIGHAGHPEVDGTMGQLPKGSIKLIETKEEAANIKVRDPDNLAYLTQTTLSVDDTAEIIATLKQRFPKIRSPHKQDICYATTNRQNAVKAIGAQVDALFVIGAANSSNSMRLMELGGRMGCKFSKLIAGAEDIDIKELAGIKSLGLTAGASAPEDLVNGVIDFLETHFNLTRHENRIAQEMIEFKLPRQLREKPRNDEAC